MTKPFREILPVSLAVVSCLIAACTTPPPPPDGIEPEPTASTPPKVATGRWKHLPSGDWMVVDGETVRIGRKGQAPYAVLVNRADGTVLYDRDDSAKRRPQRLVLQNNGGVEYICDEAPPFARQTAVFRMEVQK